MNTTRICKVVLLRVALGLVVSLSTSAAFATTFFLDTTSYSAAGHCGIGDAVKAINTAQPVNACPAGDGQFDLILLGPNQTFDISPGLDFAAPITIAADGPGVRFSSNGSRSPAIVVTACDVTLQGITVQGANLVRATQGIRLNSGCLNLNEVRVTGFTDSAISNTGGALVIDDSTIDGNVTTSSQNGGGLTSRGVGDTQINRSTFNNNRAPNGGAIRVRGGYVRAWQCTLSGNRATNGNGGGGFSQRESGETFAELDFMHSTVVRNSASGQGGGIFNATSASGSTRINATIIALNTSGGNNVADDLRGVMRDPTLQSQDGRNRNLLGVLSNPRPGGYDANLDLVNTNPRLGNLANNGGPIQTVALLSGSPAINAGVNSVANDQRRRFDLNNFPFDQRGSGFSAPKPAGGAHDLGAFEF